MMFGDVQQPESIQIELTNATGTYLMNLNDEYLQKIFSFKYITIKDLCMLAQTSRKLKEISNNIFAKAFSIWHFKDKSTCNSTCKSTLMFEARRVLFNFGSLISKLWISQSPITTDLMDLVISNCSGTLESLNLQCQIPRPRSRPISHGFNNLKELYMSNAKDADGGIGFILENTFSKLEQFVFEYDDNVDYDFEDFISRHKNLKYLTLKCNHSNDALFPIISENCKHLEELEFESELTSRIKSLASLYHLKKLTLNCIGKNRTGNLKYLYFVRSLEILELYNAHNDSEFVPVLSRLERLRSLRLSNCSGLNMNHLMYMIKKLINLKTVYIGMDVIKVDERIYLKIVDIVRGRPTSVERTLEIYCEFDVRISQYGHNVKLSPCY